MEEQNEEKRKSGNRRKQNKSAVLLIALAAIAAAGIFYAWPHIGSMLMADGAPQEQEKGNEGLGEPIPVETADTIIRDGAPEEDPTAVDEIVDRPVSSIANLHLDIRSEKTDDREKENDLSNRQIYFSGVGDEFLGYDTELRLENLAENEDFMMKYVVTNLDTDSTVFETGLIPSGEYVGWVPGHDLGEGEHHLNFHIVPYYPQGEDYLPLTSANNEVVFTIAHW